MMHDEEVAHKIIKALSLAPLISIILYALSPFGIKHQKPKTKKVEAA
jgi:hypothetical protein